MALSPSFIRSLIIDPVAVIPDRATKKERRHVEELREAYQAAMAKSIEGALLRTPEDVSEYVVPLMNAQHRESFFLLPLDVRCRMIGSPIELSRGDVDGTDAAPRLFFRAALQAGALSAVAVHNHPSGSRTISPADFAVTKNLVRAGKVLDLPLVDHIIVANGECVSIRRERPEAWNVRTD